MTIWIFSSFHCQNKFPIVWSLQNTLIKETQGKKSFVGQDTSLDHCHIKKSHRGHSRQSISVLGVSFWKTLTLVFVPNVSIFFSNCYRKACSVSYQMTRKKSAIPFRASAFKAAINSEGKKALFYKSLYDCREALIWFFFFLSGPLTKVYGLFNDSTTAKISIRVSKQT